MTFSSKVIHIRSKTENMCSYCTQNFACGNLKSALKTLESEAKRAADTYSLNLYVNYQEKLSRYGYNYPNAQSLCWLHDKKTVINELIAEAGKLTAEIRQRRRENVQPTYGKVSMS